MSTRNDQPKRFGEIKLDDGHVMELRRIEKRGGPAVVLFHGGNTSGETFTFPRGGLAGFLARKGWDVWIVDWRGSPHVIKRGAPLFTVDDVAEQDLPRAIERVRKTIGNEQHLAVVAHCLSGCALSMAIARGHIGPQVGVDVDAIVLTTLGLFFESCWDGWIKAEDFILERISAMDPRSEIDPRHPEAWPEPFREAFDSWPRAWLSRRVAFADDPLEALTFMFGRPYRRRALDTDLWVAVLLQRFAQYLATFGWGKKYRRLGKMFGPMHFGMYLHIGQMVRRGYAGRYDTIDVIDRPRIERKRACATVPRAEAVDSYLNPEAFKDRRITLIGGTENQLWHRDSVDLMYEWLRSNADGPKSCFKKVLVQGYGHQDLYWGPGAEHDVYEPILAAIR